jgi:GNAT superfamily N-acetyltransferase
MGSSIERFEGNNPPPVRSLAASASVEGYGFVDRTLMEWKAGDNRFDRPGEVFYLATTGGHVVGMCGLNIDPYPDSEGEVGRLRHLYVAPEHRRTGIGRSLVDACLAVGLQRFGRVRLRTFDQNAADFYTAIGFVRVEEPQATHSISLTKRETR